MKKTRRLIPVACVAAVGAFSLAMPATSSADVGSTCSSLGLGSLSGTTVDLSPVVRVRLFNMCQNGAANQPCANPHAFPINTPVVNIKVTLCG